MLNTPDVGLTRRSFLKTGAVVAGGAWAGVTLGCVPANDEPVEEGGQGPAEAVNSGDEIFVNCCRPNCFAQCALNVHVREGKVVKTSMADYPNSEYNRICLRGLSHVENIYHPDRVLYPMKQTGDRGSDNWERVSWDEAISDIAAKFQQYREEFGDSSIVSASGSSIYHATVNSNGRFFGTINASSMTAEVDKSNYLGINRVYGFAGLWPNSDPHDWLNAKTMFLWGNNLTDAQLQDWHFMADAMENGTKVICIDPIFTQMAAKSDMYVPIRPGSDLQLIMAMMYVIIDEDLVDWDYQREHTVAPFLVKESDGLFLRMSDLGVEPTVTTDEATDAEVTIDPYVVWDNAANTYGELSTVADPAMEGTFEVEGIKVTCAYTLLKNEVMQFSPTEASKMCEVPEDTIVELAHLAADGPVTHRVGWGPQAYDNGIHPHHAGAAMAALVGQLGFPGANYGPAIWHMFLGGNDALTTPDVPATSPSIANMYMADVIANGDFMGTPITPKALWVYSANPMCTWCDTNTMRDEVFNKFELVVTVDNMMTDTAKWSDYVLPCPHWFEYDDAVIYGSSFHVTIAEKAVEPAGEAKTDLEILNLLSTEMGLDGLLPATQQDFLEQYFDTDACAALGISYEALKEQKSIRHLPEDYRIWDNNTFLTPSGRVEYYVENPTPAGFNGTVPDLEREHLPHWFEPREAWPGTELAEKYPFVLMSERPRFRVHGQWSYNRILRELDPEPTVKINPADAAELGLKDGVHVECYNDHGHAVAKLVYNEAIRPGCLVYPKSWQTDQHLAGSWSEPLSRNCDPVAVNQSFMDCRVAVRAWEE